MGPVERGKVVGGNAAGNGINDVVQFFLSLLKGRDIMKNALKQRITVFFADLFGVDVDPDDMSVPVLLAKFKVGGRIGGQSFSGIGDDHFRILVIGHIGSVLLDQLVVFGAGIAAQLRHAVGIVDGLKNI